MSGPSSNKNYTKFLFFLFSRLLTNSRNIGAVLSPEKVKDLFKKRYLNDEDYDELSKCRSIICRKAGIDANEIRIKADCEIDVPEEDIQP